jgi:hypothetical protein
MLPKGDLTMSGYIVWHNDATNETQVWEINNGSILRRSTVVNEEGEPVFVGHPFRIVAADRYKILWHHDETNETQLWFMKTSPKNGSVSIPDQISRRATVLDELSQPVFVGPPWSIVGMSGSGVVSAPNYVTWHNGDTNEIQIWSLSDPSLEISDTSEQRIGRRITIRDENDLPILVGAPFRIVGAGVSSIVWYNENTGETQIWEMQSDYSKVRRRITLQGENGLPIFVGPPFRIVGAADFNPLPLNETQHPDIVWYNENTGETQIWFLTKDGEKISERRTVTDENNQPIFVGLPFRIVATGNTDA